MIIQNDNFYKTIHLNWCFCILPKFDYMGVNQRNKELMLDAIETSALTIVRGEWFIKNKHLNIKK